MRTVIAGFFICFFYHIAAAQKRPLDFDVPASWPVITDPELSGDGKYIDYFIGSEKDGTSLVLQSTDRSWKENIPGVSAARFSKDSRWLIFLKNNDSLGILELRKHELRFENKVGTFKIAGTGNNQWLAFRSSDSGGVLVLKNLTTGEQKNYTGVHDYTFSPTGQSLIFQQMDSGESGTNLKVQWLDLNDDQSRTIYRGEGIEKLIFDEKENQLVFLTGKQNLGSILGILYYYRYGADSARVLAGPETKDMEGMMVNGSKDIHFSQDGLNVFFSVEKYTAIQKKKPEPEAHVSIYYSGQDQLEFATRKGPFLVVMHLSQQNRLLRLQQSRDSFVQSFDRNDHYVLIHSDNFGSGAEYKWRKSASPDIYLVSAVDGSRQLIRKRLINAEVDGFSPEGKYVFWYDAVIKQWVAYNIGTKTSRVISAGIKVPLYFNDDHPDYPDAEGIAGWLEKDQAVLIYDRFDIWEIDPEGIKAPVNITGGFGVKNNIRLRVMNFQNRETACYRLNDTLLISGINISDKFNGFFKLRLGEHSRLDDLIMGPKSYYFPKTYSNVNGLPNGGDRFFPLKAEYADVYIIRPMSSTEYPNLAITTDFIHFNELTDLSPQSQYNWYTKELIHWKLFDGKRAEGILVKPENFDPHKKYPVIFFIYEKCSDALYSFFQPELSGADIDIAWFASNGYLVFIPDIYYKPGLPGESAYNSLVSAAKYLSKMSCVNAHKMGLQGHSFGGFETNYIITRTNLFAAAVSAAGLTDLVSNYDFLDGSRRMQWYYERRQGRIGASLWENASLYIKNSPVFKADKVRTPLLIMHNRHDGAVDFDQGAEWYSALNRLKKKVWLLQYEDEGHELSDKKNKLDYSIRLGQFFDHYLKDAPAPEWMSSGIHPGITNLQTH